jgi:hypothetical protein
MSRQPRKSADWQGVLLLLLTPVIEAIKLAYRLVDSIFDLDQRARDSNLRSLPHDLERDYGFLFTEYKGRILPEHSYAEPSMDQAVVEIEVGTILLRATHDRGYIDWEITSNDSRSHWQSLDQLCRRISPSDTSRYSMYLVLKHNFSAIEKLVTDSS